MSCNIEAVNVFCKHFEKWWLCILTGMSLAFSAAPMRDALNLPKLLRWENEKQTLQSHSSVCSVDGPLWCMRGCSTGGKKNVWNGLLRDFPWRHHRDWHPRLHVQNAAKRNEGSACQRTSGPLPWHVRTSVGQHPDCTAGEQLLTVCGMRIGLRASCWAFGNAASTETALCR